MTLNIVHGTRVPLPPALYPRGRLRANLDAIARVVVRERPDVVAMQEADGGGRLDRVAYLAGAAALSELVHDATPRDPAMRHGAALLSRLSLSNTASSAFATGVGDDKGWVVARVAAPGLVLDIASVHLAPFGAKRRRRQIERLVAELADRARPLVVLGDLNCPWRGPDEGVGLLARRLGLRPCDADPSPTHVFAGVRQRLDWILVSDELEVRRHRTLPDRVSDHRAVLADLALRVPVQLERGRA